MVDTRPLAEHLRALPDDVVLRLLDERPDLAAPAPRDFAALANRAGLHYSLVRALDRLDLCAADVLEAVVALGAPTPAQLREATRTLAPWRSVESGLDRLAALGLAWRAGRGPIGTPPALALVVTRPQGLGRSAALLLPLAEPRHVAAVDRALVSLLPGSERIAPPGAPRVQAVLGEPALVGRVLEQAPEGVPEVLGALADSASVGSAPGIERRAVDPRTTNPISWLLAHGLLFVVEPDTVELPMEVGRVVRGARVVRSLHAGPPTCPSAALGEAAVDSAAAAGAAEVLRLVVDLLDLWAEDPPGTLRSGGLGVREVRRTAKALGRDERSVALLVAVTDAAGLLAPGVLGEDPVVLPTPAYDDWLDLDDATRWLRLVEAWLTMARWPATTVGEERATTLLHDDVRQDAPTSREQVLGVLRDLPPGHAAGGATDGPDAAAAAVSECVRWHRPFGRAHEAATAAVLGEAALLGLTGRGGLAKAGRLLLAGDPAGARAAISSALPAPVDHVLVQADHTVVAPGPLPPALARSYATVADRESTGAATVYRITEASLRRALDQGMDAAAVLDLLATTSRTPLPQSLRYLVTDVGRRYGRLRLGPAACYVRCEDESHLAEVLADRRLKGLRARRVAPTVLVTDLTLARTMDLLRGAGFAPVAEAADGAALVGSADQRRAPTPTRRRDTSPPGRQVVDAEALAEVVRRMREGDRIRAAADAARARIDPLRFQGVTTAGMLGLLREAAQRRHAVHLAYVDRNGVRTERIVEPVDVTGGLLVAYDHLRADSRTFLLERIVSVVPLDAPASQILGEGGS